MKTPFYIAIFVFATIFTSCSKTEYDTYTIATAEYMAIDNFRSSVEITMPESIVKSGKIYAFNN